MKNIKGISIITFIMVILYAGCMQSCTTTKHTTSEVVKYDSTAIQQRDSLNIAITSLKTKYESLKKEASKTGVIFKDVPCPDVKIDSTCNQDSLAKIIRQQQDYIKSLKNTVKVNADGSVELQGQIASFNQDIDKMEKALQETSIVIIALRATNDSLVTSISNLKSNSNSTVKRKWFTGLPMYISLAVIFLAIGYVGGRKKILPFI